MLKVEYIAGFFDGEGSIGIYKMHGKSYYLRTQLTQKQMLCHAPGGWHIEKKHLTIKR